MALVLGLAAYLLIGLILGGVALRQQPGRGVGTVVAWTFLWPGAFILSRLVDPPADMDAPYRWGELAKLIAASTLPFVAGYVVAVIIGVPGARAAYTSFGLTAVFLGWRRAPWFWRSLDAQTSRILVGESLTRWMTIAIGLVFIYVGLFTSVGFPPP